MNWTVLKKYILHVKTTGFNSRINLGHVDHLPEFIQINYVDEPSSALQIYIKQWDATHSHREITPCTTKMYDPI